jgi:hypothetical protein
VRVDVGYGDAAVISHSSGQPSGNRSAATPDFETSPAAAHSGSAERVERNRVVHGRQRVEPSARFNCGILQSIMTHAASCNEPEFTTEPEESRLSEQIDH